MNIIKKYFIYIFIFAILLEAAYLWLPEKYQGKQWHNEELGESDVQFIKSHWFKSTFPTEMASVKYHVKKHGRGNSPMKYTKDALEFYENNRYSGRRITLNDGKTKAVKITTRTKGGIFTQDGRIVTFWYYNEQ